MLSKIKTCLSLVSEKEERIKTLILLFFLIIYALLEIVGIGSFPVYLLSILKPDFLQNLITEYLFFSLNLEEYSQETILIYGGIFLVTFFIIKNIFFLFIVIFEKKFIYTLISTNSLKLYKIYQKQRYIFHLNTNPSTLIRNIDLVENSILYVSYFLLFLRESLVLFITFSFLISINLKVTILTFIFFSILILILFFFTKKKTKIYGQKIIDLRIFFYKIITEGMEAIKEVKILGRSKYFSNLFRENSKNLFYNKYKIEIIKTFPKMYLEVLSVVFMCFLFIYFFNSTKDFEISIITLATYSVVIVRMLPSLTSISTGLAYLKSLHPSANTLINELNRKIDHSSVLKPSFDNNVAINKINNFFNLELKNISYGYSSEKKIINNFSIKIINKEILGIRGDSGTGKTTLINIILGLLEPDSGEIVIDNTPIKDFIDYQKIFGLVSQNIYLLDDTVKKNIAFGLSDSEIDDEKVKRSARLAQIDIFINNLQNGYDTVVGNKGIKISGGQMQRIGIARALYSNPKILILDESTSALDAKNEDKILDLIKDLKKEIAIIVISHRESTLKICDKLIDLESE
jgi:ABC-type multidrug transport system fused ATPase/permease subunit